MVESNSYGVVDLDDYFPPIEYGVLPWPDLDEEGEFNSFGWRNLLTAPHPWDESRRPYNNPLDYEDVKYDYERLYTDGFLTHMICANEISNLDVIPGTTQYGLTKLQLPGRNIRNIDVLASYKLLQYLDLSYNKINYTTPLQKIKHLIVLDLSHNRLSTFKLSPPPLFLGYLNLSSNCLFFMPNFRDIWSLKHLNLSYNNIKMIEGIEGLSFLSYLNLSHNCIVKVKNLKNISLKELDIAHNNVREWEDLPDCCPNSLYSLKILNASHNDLSSLKVFRKAYNLQVLNLSFNKISEKSEFDNMMNLVGVKKLYLNGNKISTSIQDFRCLCLKLMKNLIELNGTAVTSSEKMASIITYSKDIIINEINAHVYRTVLTVSSSPPPFGQQINVMSCDRQIVALVGLPGSYHEKITHMIATKHSTYVRRAKLHTTVPPTPDSVTIGLEDHSMHYIHVSPQTFSNMVKSGQMIFVATRRGYKFGLAGKELISDGRLSLVSFGIVGALNLFWSGYRPIIILLRTENKALFTKRIKEYFLNLQTLESIGIKRADSPVSLDDGLFTNIDDLPEDDLDPYEEKLKSRGKSRSISTFRTPETSYQVNREDFDESEIQPPVTFTNPRTKKADKESIKGERFDPKLHLLCNRTRGSANYYEIEVEIVKLLSLAKMTYIELHKAFPGLFLTTITTDDLHRAYRKTTRIVKDYYNGMSVDEVKTELNKNSIAYKEMVEVTVNKMMESILSQNDPLRPPTD